MIMKSLLVFNQAKHAIFKQRRAFLPIIFTGDDRNFYLKNVKTGRFMRTNETQIASILGLDSGLVRNEIQAELERRKEMEKKKAIKKYAYIDGRDLYANPPLTIRKVNIWKQPLSDEPSKSKFSLKHGTRVRKLQWTGLGYVKIRRFLRTGWVNIKFLSSEKEKPVGDLV